MIRPTRNTDHEDKLEVPHPTRMTYSHTLEELLATSRVYSLQIPCKTFLELHMFPGHFEQFVSIPKRYLQQDYRKRLWRDRSGSGSKSRSTRPVGQDSFQRFPVVC